ncbi:hypothetical protein BGZ76_010948 [Entomortierella beljakovae]|nr:hypothetical protein BGZ76_010948 [Entomortierella beljakovae]
MKSNNDTLHNITTDSIVNDLEKISSNPDQETINENLLQDTMSPNQALISQDFGPERPLTPVRRFLVFLGILVTLFLASLDQTIVTTTLPSIANEFSNFEDIPWVGTAYLLTTTSVQPLYGVAADLFGRSALCGAARSMTMLIIARAVQGLGGSGIITLTMILIADIVPLRQRGTYQSLVAMVFAVAGVVGPILGGAFSDHVTWRWVFYINFPIGAFSITLLCFFLHMNRRKDVSFVTNLKSLDFTGIALLVISITTILLALNWGAELKYAWSSPIILILLIVGGILGALLLFNEARYAKIPIVPLRLFGTLSLALCYLQVFIQGFIFLGLLFFLPLYFQAVNGVSAVQSGIDLLPYVIVGPSTAIVAGLVMGRYGTYKELIVTGWVFGTVASGLQISFDEHTSRGMIIVVLILLGASMGLTVNTLLLGVQAQLLSKSDVAQGTSFWTFLRTLGGVFGIAIGGVFVQSSLSRAGASQYAHNIKSIADLAPDLKAPILRAFVVGLQHFFIFLAVITCVGLISSFFIKKVEMGSSPISRNQQDSTPSTPTSTHV